MDKTSWTYNKFKKKSDSGPIWNGNVFFLRIRTKYIKVTGENHIIYCLSKLQHNLCQTSWKYNVIKVMVTNKNLLVRTKLMQISNNIN